MTRLSFSLLPRNLQQGKRPFEQTWPQQHNEAGQLGQTHKDLDVAYSEPYGWYSDQAGGNCPRLGLYWCDHPVGHRHPYRWAGEYCAEPPGTVGGADTRYDHIPSRPTQNPIRNVAAA